MITRAVTEVRTRAATEADRAAIEALLTEQGLPIPDVPLHSPDTFFLVATESHDQGSVDRVPAIVGAAGLEYHGAYALLRSVVIRADHRGRGLARLLVRQLLEEAARRAVIAVYLLTTSAEPYFPRLGFSTVNRGDVPQEIARSEEYSHACPVSASVMVVTLSHDLIVAPYDSAYRADFERLNRAWLEQLWIEPRDEQVFADPAASYLESGGAMFFALLRGQVVGTVAIRHETDDLYELCKLAVDESMRRQGIGDLLVRTVIDEARARGARRLMLTTNSILASAVRLYRRHGFTEAAIRAYPERTRANLEMYLELHPTDDRRRSAGQPATSVS